MTTKKKALAIASPLIAAAGLTAALLFSAPVLAAAASPSSATAPATPDTAPGATLSPNL